MDRRTVELVTAIGIVILVMAFLTAVLVIGIKTDFFLDGRGNAEFWNKGD